MGASSTMTSWSGYANTTGLSPAGSTTNRRAANARHLSQDIAMARHNAKGRRTSGPPFVRLFYYLMDCPAWLELMPTDRPVFLQTMRRYNGQNNGFLGASVDALA